MDPLLFGENKLPYKIGTWMNHYLLRTTDQNPVTDIAIRPFTRAHLLSRRMISITSQHSAFWHSMHLNVVQKISFCPRFFRSPAKLNSQFYKMLDLRFYRCIFISKG